MKETIEQTIAVLEQKRASIDEAITALRRIETPGLPESKPVLPPPQSREDSKAIQETKEGARGTCWTAKPTNAATGKSISCWKQDSGHARHRSGGHRKGGGAVRLHNNFGAHRQIQSRLSRDKASWRCGDYAFATLPGRGVVSFAESRRADRTREIQALSSETDAIQLRGQEEGAQHLGPARC